MTKNKRRRIIGKDGVYLTNIGRHLAQTIFKYNDIDWGRNFKYFAVYKFYNSENEFKNDTHWNLNWNDLICEIIEEYAELKDEEDFKGTFKDWLDDYDFFEIED